jgi:hypothetical protein
MKNGRNVAISAAIAAVLSAALAIGSPAARADEVSDLRANQELLQQRLDQLAQVGLSRPQEPPGTPTLAGSFPRSFLIPGTDTSIRAGGQINLTAVYFADGSNNLANTTQGTSILGGPGLSGTPLSGQGPTRARARSTFNFTVYDSRLSFETRTPTAYGAAKTLVEFDFLGCSLGGIICNNTVSGNNGLGVRLRYAYATLGGFIAGQATNPSTDLAADPEMLDTGCCVGNFGTNRQPQVGYTWDFPTGAGPASLFVSLVSPEDSAITPNSGFGTTTTLTNNSNAAFIGAGSIAAATLLASETAGTIGGSGSNQPLSVNPLKTEMPDLNAKLNFEQPWGHLALRAVVHDAPIVDGAFISQHYIGYGGAVSGDVKPNWFGFSAKDDLGFTAFEGDGLGRYAGGGGAGNYFPYLATNYGAPAGTNPLGAAVGNPCGYGHMGGTVSAACAAGIRATPINQWGGVIWYQHWWTPTIRSTAQLSIAHEDVPLALIGSKAQQGNAFFAVNKELVDAHINLLWSPVPFVDTGVEYFFGHRQTVYNAKGDMHAILSTFKMRF